MPLRERGAPSAVAISNGCSTACYRLSLHGNFLVVAGRHEGRESVAKPRVESRLESGVKARRQKCSMCGTRDERKTDERIQLVTRQTGPVYSGPETNGKPGRDRKFL